ncbi:hypothetical protein OROGR_004691 [Orobanche gracilis]
MVWGYYRGKQRDRIGDTSKGVSVVLISRNEKRGLEAVEKLKVNNAGVNGVRDSEEAIKKLQSQSESSLLSSVLSGRIEKILEVDGTVTTQPVLEHVVSNLSFNISSTDVIKLLLPMGDILSEVVLLLQSRDQICCAQRNMQYEVRADYFACACQQKIDGYNGTSFYNFTALYIIP